MPRHLGWLHIPWPLQHPRLVRRRRKSVVLRNFKCYQSETRIQVGNLTSRSGKNDVGKSTILEALEIFFNNAALKIDAQDACIHSESKEVLIGWRKDFGRSSRRELYDPG
jgi:recombinational DNA repair ATPase RecF